MQGQRCPISPVSLIDHFQLLRVLDNKRPFPLSLRQAVKGQPKRLFKQNGQPLGKSLMFGNDAYLAAAESIAVKQHPIGLRLGTALLVHL